MDAENADHYIKNLLECKRRDELHLVPSANLRRPPQYIPIGL